LTGFFYLHEFEKPWHLSIIIPLGLS
jgi:hypothetical protein